MKELEQCFLCPRNCGVNRYRTVGVCGAGSKMKIAHYGLHMWEDSYYFSSPWFGALIVIVLFAFGCWAISYLTKK